MYKKNPYPFVIFYHIPIQDWFNHVRNNRTLSFLTSSRQTVRGSVAHCLKYQNGETCVLDPFCHASHWAIFGQSYSQVELPVMHYKCWVILWTMPRDGIVAKRFISSLHLYPTFFSNGYTDRLKHLFPLLFVLTTKLSNKAWDCLKVIQQASLRLGIRTAVSQILLQQLW